MPRGEGGLGTIRESEATVGPTKTWTVRTGKFMKLNLAQPHLL